MFYPAYTLTIKAHNSKGKYQDPKISFFAFFIFKKKELDRKIDCKTTKGPLGYLLSQHYHYEYHHYYHYRKAELQV